MTTLSSTLKGVASTLTRLPQQAPRRGKTIRHRAARVAALSFLVLAVACAGKERDTLQDEFSTQQANRLFSAGYHDISEVYIEEVGIDQLALAAIRTLAEKDPAVSVEERQGHLLVHLENDRTRYFALPRDRKDAPGWAQVTASVLELAQDRSPELQGRAPEDLYSIAFEGILGELDYFSRYASAARAQDNRASRDGFGGIGVRIQVVDEGIEVLSVMEDGPAEAAGVQGGDIIVAIDGDSARKMAQREVVRLLRGMIDSSVDLMITRADAAQPLRFAVKRAHIVPSTVNYSREGDAAYIRVSGFNQDTAKSLRSAMEKAQDDIGGNLLGYVLDLRGNPGGLLDQAVAVADIFVERGRIVSTHGRHPDSHQYFSAREGDAGEEQPVVALINGSSASASEIVAAAIQDNGRGVVVGSSSYGKGTVQTVMRLPNRGELTLTWARFHAPSGYALSKRGVLPDLCTSAHYDDLGAVITGLRRGTLPTNRDLRGVDVDPLNVSAINSFRAHCPGKREETALDLEVALELLNNHDLYRLAGGTTSPKIAEIAP